MNDLSMASLQRFQALLFLFPGLRLLHDNVPPLPCKLPEVVQGKILAQSAAVTAGRN